MWSAGGSPFTKIARKYLYTGSGKGLLGEVRQFAADPYAEPPPDIPGGSQPPVIQSAIGAFWQRGGRSRSSGGGVAVAR